VKLSKQELISNALPFESQRPTFFFISLLYGGMEHFHLTLSFNKSQNKYKVYEIMDMHY
jgi:hypothetical protein